MSPFRCWPRTTTAASSRSGRRSRRSERPLKRRVGHSHHRETAPDPQRPRRSVRPASRSILVRPSSQKAVWLPARRAGADIRSDTCPTPGPLGHKPQAWSQPRETRLSFHDHSDNAASAHGLRSPTTESLADRTPGGICVRCLRAFFLPRLTVTTSRASSFTLPAHLAFEQRSFTPSRLPFTRPL